MRQKIKLNDLKGNKEGGIVAVCIVAIGGIVALGKHAIDALR